MTYFYSDSGSSVGPYSKEELKGKIEKDTLVWYQGQEDWIMASEIESLKDLFYEMPPPLPKKEKIIKVEAFIKKENKVIINDTNQIKIAKEIKNIFYFLCLALIIGVAGYFINISQTNYLKYSSLINGIKSYDKEFSELPYWNLSEVGTNSPVDKWMEKNKSRLDSLVELSKEYGYYQETGDLNKHPNTEAIAFRLNYQNSVYNEGAFTFAKRCGLISFVILIIGRYVLFLIKWVVKQNKNG